MNDVCTGIESLFPFFAVSDFEFKALRLALLLMADMMITIVFPC